MINQYLIFLKNNLIDLILILNQIFLIHQEIDHVVTKSKQQKKKKSNLFLILFKENNLQFQIVLYLNVQVNVQDLKIHVEIYD